MFSLKWEKISQPLEIAWMSKGKINDDMMANV
jgi:hypothetical protein